MKTPREILFKRHQAAESKLDAIRETAVASVGDRHGARAIGADRGCHLREFLFSLRWHLAGMGTTWLVVVLLNLNVGHSANLAASIPKQKIPSTQIIMASLRENRRQLLEIIQPPESQDAKPQKLILPQPRSQRRHEFLTA